MKKELIFKSLFILFSILYQQVFAFILTACKKYDIIKIKIMEKSNMNISISTANLYFIPFEKTLELYKRAGYEYIELAGYWRGGEWEMAQHLKDKRPKDVIRLVNDYSLKISSFHDMGGLIEEGAESVIAS